MLDLMKLAARDKHDYFPFFRWWFSKRLVYAILVIIIIASILVTCILSPWKLDTVGDGHRTFYYNSLLLKFYRGTAAVRAADGHTAYIGKVKKGRANGMGSLYDTHNRLVYKGHFSDNLYNGKGTLYYQNRMKAYEGEYLRGLRQGKGVLYNKQGEKIFTGKFWKDQIIYEEMLQKPTTQAAKMYTGQRSVYTTENQIVTYMSEINALYVAHYTAESLEEEWIVQGTYVLSDKWLTDGNNVSDLGELEKHLGKPVYEGITDAVIEDAAAVMSLKAKNPIYKKKPQLNMEKSATDVYTVTGFKQQYKMYITAFETEDNRYTFFGKEKNGPFAFYLIESSKAEGRETT